MTDTSASDPAAAVLPDGIDAPAPLPDDLRIDRKRVLPTRSDPQAAAASAVIGGPVGRHAAIGRSRNWTPVRVVLLLALVALGFSWFGKAGCVQQGAVPGGEPGQVQLNWENQRQFYGLCYSDVIALYGAQHLTIDDLRQGTMPYRTFWYSENGTDAGAKRYIEEPVLIGAFEYVAATATRGWQALVEHTPLPRQLDVVVFFNISALLLALFWLIAVWATMLTERRRIWIGALMAVSPILLVHAFTAFDVIPVALVSLALLAWSRNRVVLTGVFLGLAVSAALYPLLLVVALAVICWRDRRMRDLYAVLACAVVAWLAVNLPVLISYPQGWSAFYVALWRRGAEADSLYRLIIAATGWAPPVGLLNALFLTLLVAVIAAVCYLGLQAERTPSPAQLMFLLVAGYLIVGKAWYPQNSLWLVPLAVLAIPHARLLLAVMAIDALLWVPRMALFLDAERKWLPVEWFYVAVAVRAIAVLVLCGLVIRDLFARRVAPAPGPPSALDASPRRDWVQA